MYKFEFGVDGDGAVCSIQKKSIFNIYSYSVREGIAFELRACLGCFDHSCDHIEITLEIAFFIIIIIIMNSNIKN